MVCSIKNNTLLQCMVSQCGLTCKCVTACGDCLEEHCSVSVVQNADIEEIAQVEALLVASYIDNSNYHEYFCSCTSICAQNNFKLVEIIITQHFKYTIKVSI